MDSTQRSNATVGPPIDLLTCEADSILNPDRIVFEEGHEYLRRLRTAWQEALQRSFEALPDVPAPLPNVRLLDARGDQPSFAANAWAAGRGSPGAAITSSYLSRGS